MKRALSCLLGLSLICSSNTIQASDVPEPSAGDLTMFVGVWHADVRPTQSSASAGRNAFKDYLLFEADGALTAEAFGPLGYDRSPYAVTDNGDGTLSFSATMTNTMQGTLVWSGTRRNGVIVGSLVWTKPDGSVGQYTFQAEALPE